MIFTELLFFNETWAKTRTYHNHQFPIPSTCAVLVPIRAGRLHIFFYLNLINFYNHSAVTLINQVYARRGLSLLVLPDAPANLIQRGQPAWQSKDRVRRL